MPRKKSKVEASLQKKGFEKSERHHHYFSYVTIEGKRTAIKTKTSHTPKMKDIPDNLLSQMAKQCKVDKKHFIDLIDCSLDQKGYEKILCSKNFLG